jgi:hypothetical protein
VPKLPLEREVSEDEVQKAIEQFSRNFADVYPSAGPAVCMRPLNQVMKQSIFNPDEVSINKIWVFEFKILEFYSDVRY